MAVVTMLFERISGSGQQPRERALSAKPVGLAIITAAGGLESEEGQRGCPTADPREGG